jgi:hypothetical protein
MVGWRVSSRVPSTEQSSCGTTRRVAELSRRPTSQEKSGRTSPPSRATAIARCRQVSRSASPTRLRDRTGSHIGQSPSGGDRRGTPHRHRYEVRAEPDQASCAGGGTTDASLEAATEPRQARHRESSADRPRLLPDSDGGSRRHGSQRPIVVGPLPHRLVRRGGRRDRQGLGARTPGASRQATIGERMTADRRSLGSGILTMWTSITIMSLTLCESSHCGREVVASALVIDTSRTCDQYSAEAEEVAGAINRPSRSTPSLGGTLRRTPPCRPN